ncbi:hypothetical protein [Variovorax sp. PDC80]|uniref:hypothetical protein n=1 Tax=Variovorax sp. PDC80 TaxID=1882827 RepID=UPI0011603FE6|nr:hypothetical protein [Variovorax sp. PDC80]
MRKVELLTIEDQFQLSGVGLTLAPDFPVPKGWENILDVVTVVTPEGEVFDAVAQFNLTHFNFRSAEAGIDRQTVASSSVVAGCLEGASSHRRRIFASQSVRTSVLGEDFA